MIYRRAAVAVALLIFASGAVLGADYTMGRYDANQTSYTAERLGLPLILNWEYVGSKYENNPASPVVVGNTVVFACGDRVYGVDLATGSLKWRYPSDQGLSGSVKATPAIYGGNVYFGAGENLFCISLETGTFRWAYQTRGAIRCAPVILDGSIYFGSDDNSLYCIDAETGDPRWSKPFVARDDIAIGVAIGSGIVVASCMDGNTYGVMAGSGRLRWPPFRLPMAPTDTAPAISENVAVVAVGNAMYGLAARSGQLRWMVQLPAEVAASPALLGFDVFVPCRDKKIYAYSTTGRRPALKWVGPADLGATPMSTPVIAGDTLWVTGARGVIAGFSVGDGTLKWRYVAAPSSVTTPNSGYCDAASSPTVANGALLVLTDDGVLRCFTPDAADNIPPGVFTPTPAAGTVMSPAPPIKMSAVLYDIGSGVDPASVSMMLDGQPVDTGDKKLFDVTTGTVAYETPMGGTDKQAVKLSDGIHTITVAAKDYAGNELKHDWYIVADSSLPPPRRSAPVVEPGKKEKEPVGKTSPRAQPTPPTPPAVGPTAGTPGEFEAPPPPPPPPPTPTPGPGAGGPPAPEGF